MMVALASAAGSPGVTTTCLGLTEAASRAEATSRRTAICVEADPVGGSAILAGYFRGFESPGVTAVDLLLASHDDDFTTTVDHALVPMGAGGFVLPGPRSHRQAASVIDLWPVLAAELAVRPATDVFVDLGRLGMASFAEAFVWAADAIALVMRCDLPAISAARQWADWLIELRRSRPEMGPAGLIVIGPGRPYSAREIGRGLDLPVWASLGWYPAGAAVYAVGAQRRKKRLSSQYTAAAQALAQVAESRSQVLGAVHG